MAMVWRFINTGFGTGSWNMAVDEAMFLAHARGLVPPTLRVYQWLPPALSLGYFQSVSEVNEGACRQHGIDIVRRPTGGRAVLHAEEITYSVVVAERLIPKGHSVSESYRILCGGLIEGLERLGVKAEHKEQRQPSGMKAGERSPVCFAEVHRGDLVVKGRKLAGSAQARRDRVLLQHGSIPLRLDLSLLRAVLQTREQVDLSAAMTDLASALEGSALPTVQQVAGHLRAGFESALCIRLLDASLTPWELAEAQRLQPSRGPVWIA